MRVLYYYLRRTDPSNDDGQKRRGEGVQSKIDLFSFVSKLYRNKQFNWIYSLSRRDNVKVVELEASV